MIKAVIFDMDGVLFDTEGFYFDRRKIFLEQKGILIDHLAPKDFIGGNVNQIWQLVLGSDYKQWDIKKLEEEYAAFKAGHPAPYQELLMPKVKETLIALKKAGYALGLASSSAMCDIERALKDADLYSFFNVILSGEQFPESKPHPAIYQAAVQQLAVKQAEVVVVEDSQKGIEAAKRAGLRVLALRDDRFGVDQGQADQMIEGLDEVARMLS